MLARFRVEETSRGRVLPHEQTRKAAKEDRYKLLKATRANFSPIFLMFSDGQGAFAKQAEAAAAAPPDFQYTDDGGVAPPRLAHPRRRRRLRPAERDRVRAKAYIADGHHRWATAQRYHQEVGAEAAWTLGYFTPMEAPGLVVLPYHRLLDRGPSLEEARRALSAGFELTDVRGAPAAARAAAQSKTPYAFAPRGARAAPASSRRRGRRRRTCCPRTRRPACAPSTPSSCTRPCCRACSACPTTPCATPTPCARSRRS